VDFLPDRVRGDFIGSSLHCNELFLPDYRSGPRQRYCLKAECRKVRKRELMRAWLAKPENQNYFRDAGNAERVRDWQKAHPGYWKNTARYRRRTLPDGCAEQTPAAPAGAPTPPSRTLQDLCAMQVPLFVGLISMFVGSTLPDDIARSTRRLLLKGHDILGMVPGMNLERLLHEKTCPQSGATPESSAPVQLDRSPAGAGKLLRPV
jgi:hypothetical protein